MIWDSCATCGMYNLWFKALPIENMSGGAMNANRPNCKPACFYLSNKKHKDFLTILMTTGSARNKQKKITNEWYLEWFLYPILHGTTKTDAIPWEAPPHVTDWKQQNWYDFIPWLYRWLMKLINLVCIHVYIYIYQSMYIHTEYKAIQKDATTYIYIYIYPIRNIHCKTYPTH